MNKKNRVVLLLSTAPLLMVDVNEQDVVAENSSGGGVELIPFERNAYKQ